MDQVVTAATPEERARMDARNKIMEQRTAQAAKELPKFVGPSADHRTLTVPLDYPVEYEGQIIDSVVVRRPVMREWRTYLRACADAIDVGGPGADDLVDQPWLSIPAHVLENLDTIDASRVEAAQEGFFARPAPDGGTGNPDEST